MFTTEISILKNTFAPGIRIFAEDLEEIKIIARDMIDDVKRGELFLYTLLAVDYLTRSSRHFEGIIKHEFGQTSAEFIVERVT